MHETFIHFFKTLFGITFIVFDKKRIVSRDWGGLKTILLDRLEVLNISALSYHVRDNKATLSWLFLKLRYENSDEKKPGAEILETSNVSNKIVFKPPQSCETIPLKWSFIRRLASHLYLDLNFF